MLKDNKLLNPIISALAAVYCLGASTLAALPSKSKEFVLSENILSLLIELIVAAFTILICFKVFPKVFSNCKNYEIKLPSLSKIFAILLIMPFIAIIKYDLIYNIVINESNSYIAEPFITSNIYEDLIESISAIFLAPVIEELSFRYMAITPYKSKSARIIVLILISLFFGIVHVRNFIAATFDAIIYGIVLLYTKNIGYSILCHSFTNLSSLIFELLATYNIADIRYINNPVIIVFPNNIQIVFGLMAIAGFIVLFLNKNKKKMPEI